MYENSNEKNINTHLSCGCGGIDGFFTAEELVKWYGDCECYIEEYEKDYGDCVAIRSFLKIITDKNYREEIEKERIRNEYLFKKGVI